MKDSDFHSKIVLLSSMYIWDYTDVSPIIP